MKLVHVSDTHLKPFHPEAGDILIHSGDALNYGDLQDLIEFREQLKQIHNNYKHIIFVPGNHDRIFEEDINLARGLLYEAIDNLYVLHNAELELEGLKFYGSADQPQFCNWAFNRDPHELVESYNKIPLDTDVLITHCPPKGIRDIVYGKSVGSPELAAALPNLKQLKLHCYGHIHYSAGLEKINEVWYSNGSICNEQYSPVNKENIIELS